LRQTHRRLTMIAGLLLVLIAGFGIITQLLD
jgi:hypothetical protein